MRASTFFAAPLVAMAAAQSASTNETVSVSYILNLTTANI